MKRYLVLLNMSFVLVLGSACSGELNPTKSEAEPQLTPAVEKKKDDTNPDVTKKAPAPEPETSHVEHVDKTAPKKVPEAKYPTAAPASSTQISRTPERIQTDVSAKNRQKMYIFGHSLIKHDHHENAYGTDVTSVPYWMALMAQRGGLDYSVSGKYGFLRNHLDYVLAQWGFHSRSVKIAWNDDDGMSFSQVGFDTIMITPANFIQYQAPSEKYYDSNDTPISATLDIIDWSLQRAPNATIYIYENWPDMGDPFPPSASKLASYHQKTAGEVHRWWNEYYDALVRARPNADIKMIPVGSIIARLLSSPPLTSITLDDLYEDSAPHGRPNIYFLAAMITYSATFKQQVPADYQPEQPVHTLIQQNYGQLRQQIWQMLNEYNRSGSGNRIW
jgi:hypothetical protein